MNSRGFWRRPTPVYIETTVRQLNARLTLPFIASYLLKFSLLIIQEVDMPPTLPRLDNVSFLFLVLSIIAVPCSSTQASAAPSSAVGNTHEQGFWKNDATKAAASKSDTRGPDSAQGGVIHLPLVRRLKRSALDAKKGGAKESGLRGRKKGRNMPKPVALRDLQDMCVLFTHKV